MHYTHINILLVQLDILLHCLQHFYLEPSKLQQKERIQLEQ